jgi:hypothetical protein
MITRRDSEKLIKDVGAAAHICASQYPDVGTWITQDPFLAVLFVGVPLEFLREPIDASLQQVLHACLLTGLYFCYSSCVREGQILGARGATKSNLTKRLYFYVMRATSALARIARWQPYEWD